MVVASLEDYIRQIKEGQSSTTTLNWYLHQIRTLAAHHVGETVSPKQISATKIQKSLEQINEPRTQARDEVKKEYVVETTTRMDNRMIGKMLFFQYDPKLKQQLPYYDVFPLVFLINNRKAGSSLAFNMHYLPPYERARLMFQLYTLVNTTTLDENSRLLLTYKVLNENSKFVFFKPCIKRYLYGHIRSRVMVVNPKEWNRVMMLPLAKFMKKSEWAVWEDSVKKIRQSTFKVNQ